MQGNQFFIGSWIPTLRTLEHGREGKVKKSYKIGDGLPQFITVEFSLKVPAGSKVVYEGKGNIYYDGSGELICAVDSIEIFENGLWKAMVKWKKELHKEVRQSIYLKFFQALKERLHKHRFHHDEQDALIQVKESKADMDKQILVDYIHAIYIQKFEEYIDHLNDLNISPKMAWFQFKKAMGEVAFYRSFSYLTETRPFPADSLLNAARHNLFSPEELWIQRLTVFGIVIGVLSLLVGALELVSG
jgi:hypothetical protein